MGEIERYEALHGRILSGFCCPLGKIARNAEFQNSRHLIQGNPTKNPRTKIRALKLRAGWALSADSDKLRGKFEGICIECRLSH